nr:unnamed protein product [Callosobruchus analis]
MSTWLVLLKVLITTSFTQNILVYEQLDEGKAVVDIFVDLSRAFDTLDSKILSVKLNALDIRGAINQWIISQIKKFKLK